MVSARSIFFFAAFVAACNGYSHPHHKRYQLHPRMFSNTTTTVVPIGTGIESPSDVPIETAITTPIVTSSPDEPTPSCITTTIVETKTYTYTLGNGHAVTTTITQTNVRTETISGTPVPNPTEHPEVQVPPEHPEVQVPGETPVKISSTTTSTTTVVETITRHLPPTEVGQTIPTAPADSQPIPPVGGNPDQDAPCSVETVYQPTTVYLPETVYVTVPLSISTVTVTETPEAVPTVGDQTTAPPPVHTPPPVFTPPYANTTIHTNTTAPATAAVTYTVIPIPFDE